MKNYDVLVIGWGKAGKTLAKNLAQEGKQIAMVEQSSKMYGGTCINVACIPTKTLVEEGLKTNSFDQSMDRKQDVVSALNQKNFKNLDSEDAVDTYTLRAEFENDHEVNLLNDNGEVEETLHADTIIINTGSKSNIPPIDGIDTAQNLVDSEGIMELPEQPKELVIVGAGYIGLEFASMFASFGSNVTVVHLDENILGNEDDDIANEVRKHLEERGVTIVDKAETKAFEQDGDQTVVKTSQGDYKADAVLLATGRKPNLDLGLDKAGVELTDQGFVQVNTHLQTTVPHIYAVGDIRGGAQFTYTSLDDYRIVKAHLADGEEAKRTTETRGHIPYTLFVDPHLGRVGLTADQAKEQGHKVKEGVVPVASIPRHKIDHDDRGLFKVVVDEETDLILGASLYGKGAEELINIIKIAMDQDLPYTVLRDNIYTHPTMAESFNNLFDI